MHANTSGLRIRYFSDEQVTKIHANALDLLESPGFMVEHRGSLEILRDFGAEVDFDKQVVKVKPDLVQKCMSATVNQFLLGARDPDKAFTVETAPLFPVT